MKKGFTLIELLAVIILMAILLLLVYPKVVNISKEKEKEIDNAKIKLIENATLEYMNNNVNTYPKNVGTSYCISLETLDNENLIPVEIDDVKANYQYIRVKIGANSNYSYTLKKDENSCNK